MSNTWKPFQKGVKRTGLAIVTFGACLILGGLAFAFSPVLLAFLSTPPGGNMYSEGGGGGGAAIWLMILTLPIGASVAMFGLVTMIGGVIATMTMKLPTVEEDAVGRSKVLAHRAIALTALLPLSLLISPIVAFVLGNMIVGGDSGLIAFFTIVAMQVVAGGFAIYFAILSKKTILLSILSAVVLLSLLGSYYVSFWVYGFRITTW